MRFLEFYLIVLLVSTFFTSVGQKVQWASKVVSFSSQYDKEEKSANEILGKYNALPNGGDTKTAWAVKKKGSEECPDPAFIRVAYESPMRIQQVAIAESNNPGAVTKVILYGAEGGEQVGYEGAAKAVGKTARMFNIILENPTEFFVSEIEIKLEPGKVEGWNLIDAIGISDGKDSIKGVINLIPNLVFGSGPENLGKNINSIYDEMAPKITPDGRTLYFTRKFHPDNTGGFKDEDDIWISKQMVVGKKANVDSGEEEDVYEWSIAENVGPPLNTKLNNYVQAITPDGNSLLVANIYNKDFTMAPGVSLSYKAKEGWSYPEKQIIVDFYNLSVNANYYLSNDGRFLLMAITRKDGYGGLDLYVSFRKGDDRWSKPKNLSSQINTTQNDFSPFLAADGVTLFFSTSGHAGYGSDDIFMTSRLDDTWEKWSEPQNLGDGLNSVNSDTKYNIPASGEYAYYSSTNNSFGKNDIYRIKLPEIIKPKPVVLISGRVLNERNMKGVGAKIIYEDLETGEEVGIARSDPNTGEYKIVLPAGKKYGFRAIAKGHYSVTSNLDLEGASEYAEMEKDLRLAPIEAGAVFTLNNIFFEFAKAVLTIESYPELSRVAKLLQENPKMKVEISGHTDDVGTDETNEKLSLARAQAVKDYLVKNGVGEDRVTSVGYGETRPVAFNNSEEGRQMNRRVEFKILKVE